MAWLGQAEPVIEETGEAPTETEEPAINQQVQWLTLLTPCAAPAIPEAPAILEELPVAPMVALDAPAAEMTVLPVEAQALPKQTPEEEDPESVVVAEPAAPKPEPMPMTVPAPTQPALVAPGAIVEPEQPAPSETRKAPVQLAVTDQTPASTEKLPSLPQKPAKGELIWKADFAIADQAPNQPPAETAEHPVPVKGLPVVAVSPRRESAPADSQAQQQSAGGQRQNENQPAPPPGDKAPDRPAPIEATAAVEAPEPVRAEKRASASAKPEAAIPAATAPVNHRQDPPAAPHGPETPPEPAVDGATLEPTRPLRPAQIATLYVDVPAAPGAEDAGTIRLAVTQRGEQVNVRVRSWDSDAAPIENERMQPLLQSLSEQGYEAKNHTVEPTGDRGSLNVDKLAEKPISGTETNNNTNDQQSFHNADDRQRKQQERQQQAFLLRRQLQKVNTETFDLQSQLDPFNSKHQGALR